MAKPNPEAEKALFFTAVLAADAACLDLARERLREAWGEIVEALPPQPFRDTDYYQAELGPAPLRSIYFFSEDFPTHTLADRKLASNDLEKTLANHINSPWPRPVNLDPGYLTLAKVVLASAKNFSHRVHLRQGIFAEVTLQYRQGAYQAFPWTFPDYASGDYFPLFLQMRKRLKCQPKSKPN